VSTIRFLPAWFRRPDEGHSGCPVRSLFLQASLVSEACGNAAYAFIRTQRYRVVLWHCQVIVQSHGQPVLPEKRLRRNRMDTLVNARALFWTKGRLLRPVLQSRCQAVQSILHRKATVRYSLSGVQSLPGSAADADDFSYCCASIADMALGCQVSPQTLARLMQCLV